MDNKTVLNKEGIERYIRRPVFIIIMTTEWLIGVLIALKNNT